MKYLVGRFLFAAMVCSIVQVAAGQSAPPPPVRDGVFTLEQATRGEQLYFAKCAECHGDTLAGIEMSPALAGSAFNATWEGKTLLALADRVKTMPQRAPNTLSRKEILDLTSYILWANEWPVGSVALADDNAVLAAIKYHAPVPAH